MGAYTVHASTTIGTIDTTYKYAWSNVGGWVNFGATNGGVTVTDAALSGYAWSQNDGWINLAPSQSGVTNDGAGNLSGFAWDAGAGWVNFSGVTINSSGKFTGTATGGTVNGASYVINFDCTNCDVRTDWRPSSSRTTTTVTSNGSIGLFPPPPSQTSSVATQTGQPNPFPGLPPAQNTSGNPPSGSGSASVGAAGQLTPSSPGGKSTGSAGKTSTSTRVQKQNPASAWFPNSKAVEHAAVPISIVVIAFFLIFLIRFIL